MAWALLLITSNGSRNEGDFLVSVSDDLTGADSVDTLLTQRAPVPINLGITSMDKTSVTIHAVC